MKVIIIDPGHGGNDPGAVNKEYFEKKYNLAIAKKIQATLQNNYEVTVVMTRTGDTTVSLEERTNLANSKNAELFVSIHQTIGGGEGFGSYVHPRAGAETKRIQGVLHASVAAVMSKYGARDRGQEQADFHVLRETKKSALLLEVLFMDNEKDLALLKREDFQNDVSIAVAKGIAQSLSLPKKQVQITQTQIFNVIAGAFEQKENAVARVSLLAKQNVTAFIDEINSGNKTYYRVQAGAFQNREYAENFAKKIRSEGVTDAYVVEKTPLVQEPPKPNPEPPKPAPPKGLTIQGSSLLSAEEMDQFVKKVNPNAPSVAALYVQIGQVYGIRGDVAFAQAIQETGYFRFEGSVKASQNNYAGIGATGKNESAVFKTPQEGVLAHIQHLFAYTSAQPLPSQYPLVDPRFQYVQRGSAVTWAQLNGKWAIPGTTYSTMILNIYKKMLNEARIPLQTRINSLNATLNEL
ncbi:N-acetylmuramoyl-L-alanine amidase [Fictibacillus norfolkensis]|uniref:N-acetylmuramoyl-L-alanine amidase n=1 Tax=Fictibacillus norfolkensis TaxID=2762233 RepID=A0ABR8SMA2_9BACL|nr:N-acetylmuramoyl-L-alanine amidase [Fictibacillus norfolkensis]MBD7964613.1 N-acetylmuramoyl-L-alanine amidase [Fictibacillus norfolkensis]